jgi:hypothetical protein
VIPDLNLPIHAYRAAIPSVLAVQLTDDNLVEVADWISDNGVHCDQHGGHISFPAPSGPVGETAVPGDWVLTVDGSAFWAMEDSEFGRDWKPVEDEEPPPSPAEDLPPGVYARIELPGYRNHTGWLTEETRYGVQMAVIRDWDGLEIAEVAIGPGCQIIRLATPLKRPEPPPQRLAIPSSRDPWDSDEDDLDNEREPF